MTREAIHDEHGNIIGATCVDKPLSDRAREAITEVVRAVHASMVDEEPTTFDPCPHGCGRTTEDPYGGPCKACWDALDAEEQS